MQLPKLAIIRGLTITFILFLLTAVLTAVLTAQSGIKIKTRVELKPNGNQTQVRSYASGSLPPNWYAVEESCSYLFQIYLRSMYSAPPEDKIEVTIHDKALHDTTLIFCPANYINQRNNWDETAYDACNRTAVNYVSFTAYSYNPALAFMVPDLHQGDTLEFSYHNCLDGPYNNIGDIQFAIRDAHVEGCIFINMKAQYESHWLVA